MARTQSKVTPPLQPKKVLTTDGITRAISRLNQRVQELKEFDVSLAPEGRSPVLTALSAAIRDSLDRAFGENTSAYNRFERAATLSWSPGMIVGDYPQPHHYRSGVTANINNAIALLEEGQRVLGEDLEDASSSGEVPKSKPKPSQANNKIFVVHGHDDAAKQSLARFLEKVGLTAIILHEQLDQGRTIIEKFETFAGQAAFAVILLTPDDVGSSKSSSDQASRARQNVVFELGYFAGKLGRGKTFLLRKGDVEIPSDLYGVIYSTLDDGEGWKVKLVKEMKGAGLVFDANKLWE